MFRSAGCFLPEPEKEAVILQRNVNQFFYQSCHTPVRWLRAISDNTLLIQLDWSQIGCKDADRPDVVSRETITRLTAYFAGQLTTFNIPLRPVGSSQLSPSHKHNVARKAFLIAHEKS